MSKKRVKVQRNDKRWVIAGMAAVILVSGVLIIASMSFASPAAPQVQANATASAMSTCGGPVCGQADAPVKIEVYSDLQCPYCARLEGVLQQLAPKYIDPGLVQVSYRNYIVIGPESDWAAQAALCAGEQTKFWTFADYVFTHQAGENTGTFSRDNLKKIAAQLGLASSPFNACLDSGKYVTQVKQETAEGKQRGVQATPTLFVNGQRIEGAVPVDQLVAVIEAKLQK